MRSRLVASALALMVSSSFLFAQSPGTEAQEPSDQQTEDPIRKRAMRSRNDPMALLDAVTEGVGLDEAQRLQAEQFISEHRSKLMEIRASFQPSSELNEKTRALLDQLRTAQQNGDTEAVRIVSDQLRELRKERMAHQAPMREKMAEASKTLHDQIEALLRPDQKEKFEEIWTERMDPGARYRGRQRSPQALKAMVDRLPGMTDAQKAQIEQHFRTYRESIKNEPADSPVRKQMTNQLYDSVTALLTPEQREIVVSQMAGRSSSPDDAEERQDQGQPGDKPQS